MKQDLKNQFFAVRTILHEKFSIHFAIKKNFELSRHTTLPRTI